MSVACRGMPEFVRNRLSFDEVGMVDDLFVDSVGGADVATEAVCQSLFAIDLCQCEFEAIDDRVDMGRGHCEGAVGKLCALSW